MRRPLLYIVMVCVLGLALYLAEQRLAEERIPEPAPEVVEFLSTVTLPEATSTPKTPSPVPRKDLPPEEPLPETTASARGIYLTGWSAGSASRVAAAKALIKKNGMDAIVIDIKDYSGYVSYKMPVPEVIAVGADKQIRIARPNALLDELHAAGIYVIGRVTVFEDSIFAVANPHLALRSSSTGELWRDRQGLMWLDPAATSTWEYAAAIAADAFERGFDEVQFDYIRFPTDGKIGDITYPVWDRAEPRHKVISRFFKYLRERFPNDTISGDLFGLAAVDRSDIGIGQVLEEALLAFDFVSPMVYPSHFAPGFQGYANPAEHPYEVIAYSMGEATRRREELAKKYPELRVGRLRPWLQQFDIGARYDRHKIEAQIRATEESVGSTTAAYGGWLLWDPKTTYIDLK